MLPVPSEGEISPLRSASVEMTGMGAAFFVIRPPSEMTRGALVTIVISSGAACRYGADGKRIDDTLSREIFCRNADGIVTRAGNL